MRPLLAVMYRDIKNYLTRVGYNISDLPNNACRL